MTFLVDLISTTVIEQEKKKKNGKRNGGETYPCNSLLFENVLEKKVPGTATLTGDTDGG